MYNYKNSFKFVLSIIQTQNPMKKTLFILPILALAFFTACESNPAGENNADLKAGMGKNQSGNTVTNDTAKAIAETPATTSIAFDEDNFNFGEIPQGDPASHKFVFTNSGTENLVIESVKPSCSCTVTDYTKEPVPPGGKGYVIAEYSAKNEGVFKKSVTVIANTDPKAKILNINGEVVK